MNHYESAVQLLKMSDESAQEAFREWTDSGDPMAAIPGMVGAVVHIMAAQAHATLALVRQGRTDGDA